ncbi:hypothetical protein [Sphingobacterium bovistauri]|uniref:Lipoprotein n=1 Tax=Sphingobacterium bovistauri TaxID=2781959 RepID=A0ABS7Z2L8_9SPHI|nr:hypothetical protein [Sphingobacterium bovistauri]MCA5004416.1 hypothetical protein [Sphingobacterium bovistauri]
MKNILLFGLLLIGNFACDSRSRNSIYTVADPVSDSIGALINKDSVVFKNDTIAIYKIDSIDFFNHRSKAKLVLDTIPYISDFEKAKDLLKGKVTFGGYNSDTNKIDSTVDGEMIYSVYPSVGKTIISNEQEYFWDAGFVHYYPTLDILLCEGGHTSDFSIDLRNGKIGADIVGNPAYISVSPTDIYRLNGWFPGQECSDYFLQKKTAQGYQLLARIPMHISKEGFDFCTLKDYYWINDDTLYFRNFYYGAPDDSRLGFFRLQIN